MSALVVTIHALLLARAEIQRDRDSLFESTVSQASGRVEDEADAAAIAGYDHTLASIEEALEQAKRDPVPLRDYFAGRALDAVAMSPGHLHAEQAAYDRIATHCFRMADAMLKARQA